MQTNAIDFKLLCLFVMIVFPSYAFAEKEAALKETIIEGKS